MQKNAKDIPRYPPLQGVVISLDTYDDIFSDFDSRDYASRTLSDDFLGELRRIVREHDKRDDSREFHLLIPSALRNKQTEDIISHRLHNYFHKVDLSLREDLRTSKSKGLLLLVAGLVCLLTAGYISFLHPAQLGLHLVMVVFEPAGWFFIWMGYDKLFGALSRKKADVGFHSRMTKSKILFNAL